MSDTLFEIGTPIHGSTLIAKELAVLLQQNGAMQIDVESFIAFMAQKGYTRERSLRLIRSGISSGDIRLTNTLQLTQR
jgi:tRNA uridine 5-carbamoylmethylation protein Kti12